MMRAVVVATAVLAVLLGHFPGAFACREIAVRSVRNPFLDGTFALQGVSESRFPFFQDAQGRCLAFVHGKWLLAEHENSDSGWAFQHSAAPLPHLMFRDAARPPSVYDGEARTWRTDDSLQMVCTDQDGDRTAYLVTSDREVEFVEGHYVLTALENEGLPVFVNTRFMQRVIRHPASSDGQDPGAQRQVGMEPWVAEKLQPLYLFASQGGKRWNIASSLVEEDAIVFAQRATSGSDGAMHSLQDLSSSATLRWEHDSQPMSTKFLFVPYTRDPAVPNETGWQRLLNTRSVVASGRSRLDTTQFTGAGGLEYYIRLRNGVTMPRVGLGTGAMHPSESRYAMQRALQLGYRLLDSASAYLNEEHIGSILSPDGADGMPTREEVFITTKVWPTDLGFEETMEAFETSLAKLNTTYVDLYMLHWPRCLEGVSWMDCSVATGGTWQQSWRALEKLYRDGKVLSIGVSNFDLNLMQQLVELPAEVLPHVVQNHVDPANMQRERAFLQFCRERGIVVQAYSSLRSISMPDQELAAQLEPRVRDQYRTQIRRIDRLAGELKHSRQETVLKWLLTEGLAVIPRSARDVHLLKNLATLRAPLSRDHMQYLETGNEALLRVQQRKAREL